MKFFLVILSFIVLNLMCLAKSGKGYNSEGMYVHYIHPSGEEMAKHTVGKDVAIVHDTFFKFYVIMLTDEDGLGKTLKLSYQITKGTDEIYVNGDGIKFVLKDKLDNEGILEFTCRSEESGGIVKYIIEKAVRDDSLVPD